MSTATATIEYLLARAAVRADALMHIASRRNTGLLNPVCGAHPIRSREITEWTAIPTDLGALCGDCAALAVSIPGVESIEEGLAVFVGGGPERPASSRLLELPLDAIVSVAELRKPGAGLTAAVKRNGIITPIVVRRVGRGLSLVDGGRRLAAARAAGLTTIPAIVRTVGEKQSVVEQLLANLHREDLDPIAQALAYVDAIEKLGLPSKQALADGLGLSRSAVSNTIRLLQLPEHLRAHVADGTLRIEQARALLACSSEAEQDALADQFLAGARPAAGSRPAPDPALTAIADMLAQVLTAKVAIRTRGDDVEFVFRVPTAERDRVLAQLTPAA